MAQWKRNRLGIMSLPVRSLASHSVLRIWLCRELWCRLQTQLGSDVAVAVAEASSCSSSWTPSQGELLLLSKGSEEPGPRTQTQPSSFSLCRGPLGKQGDKLHLISKEKSDRPSMCPMSHEEISQIPARF